MALGTVSRFMGVIDIPTTPLSAATSPLSLSGVISGPRIAANVAKLPELLSRRQTWGVQ
jgi:hypothetical protein